MPFDSANYGSEEMQLLLRGRHRIENGWVQGKLVAERGDGVLHFCMLGSIQCADDGTQVNSPAITKALRLLTDVIRKLCNTKVVLANRTIPNYNDAPGRTKDEVLHVFDTAIKMQIVDDLHRVV